MSSTYNGNASNYATSITIPGDTDEVNAAAFNPAYEGLADRTAYLKARTELVVADTTALAAIAAPADGTVRHVLGQGWYVFKTSATAGLSPFRVAAGDATPGGWVSSTAHETVKTLYVPCNKVVACTLSAVAPSATPVWDIPASGASFFYETCGGIIAANASTHATNAYGFLLPIDDDLIDGATLFEAVLYFWAVNTGSDPTVRPQFGVFRADRASISPTPAALISSGGGFVVGSGGTYENNQQSITYTPNQNNVIDKASYNYSIVIFDEHGTNAVAFSRLRKVAITLTNIPDAGRR